MQFYDENPFTIPNRSFLRLFLGLDWKFRPFWLIGQSLYFCLIEGYVRFSQSVTFSQLIVVLAFSFEVFPPILWLRIIIVENMIVIIKMIRMTMTINMFIVIMKMTITIVVVLLVVAKFFKFCKI